jgi:hypothetical protein
MQPSGFQCHVVQTEPDVFEGHITSIFRSNSKPSKKQSLPPLPAGFMLGILSDLEDGCDVCVQNVRLCLNYLYIATQKAVLFIATAVRTSRFCHGCNML